MRTQHVAEIIMRTELNKMSDEFCVMASRRERKVAAAPGSRPQERELEPLAVDAAFADESLPMLRERASRRDHSHTASDDAAEISSAETIGSDDALLRSLSAQLELLDQQQSQIRMLLDQAGRRRVDRIAN
jgi:hypothetical protein